MSVDIKPYRTESAPAALDSTPRCSSVTEFDLASISEQGASLNDSLQIKEPVTFVTITRSCCSILFRALIAVAFIGIAITALSFSIDNQNENKVTTTPANIHKHKHIVHPYVNQISRGVYTTVRMLVRNESIEDFVESEWMQDKENQRVKMTIGTKGTETWIKDIFACRRDIFIVEPRPNGKELCIRDNTTNYHQFIASFGYDYMDFKRKEVFADRGDIEVFAYRGYAHDPILNVTNIVVRYVAADGSNRQLGWDVIPSSHKSESEIQIYEYWYGDAENKQPDHDVFSLPIQCADKCGDQECMCWL